MEIQDSDEEYYKQGWYNVFCFNIFSTGLSIYQKMSRFVLRSP
jgi:hypothetical protein